MNARLNIQHRYLKRDNLFPQNYQFQSHIFILFIYLLLFSLPSLQHWTIFTCQHFNLSFTLTLLAVWSVRDVFFPVDYCKWDLSWKTEKLEAFLFSDVFLSDWYNSINCFWQLKFDFWEKMRKRKSVNFFCHLPFFWSVP